MIFGHVVSDLNTWLTSNYTLLSWFSSLTHKCCVWTFNLPKETLSCDSECIFFSHMIHLYNVIVYTVYILPHIPIILWVINSQVVIVCHICSICSPPFFVIAYSPFTFLNIPTYFFLANSFNWPFWHYLGLKDLITVSSPHHSLLQQPVCCFLVYVSSILFIFFISSSPQNT